MAPPFQHHHLLIRHHLGELSEGGIESFDMAHLKQSSGFTRCLNQCGGFILAGGDRFLDQHMNARLEASQSHRMVQQGRNGDADGLNLRQQGRVIREPLATELFFGQLTAIGIGIGHTDQLSILEKAQHPRVVPTHVADADHPHLHWMHGGGGHQRMG